MNDDVMKRVKEAGQTLIEHCDSVQIFVTGTEGGETESYVFGLGNWWARIGQIRDWTVFQDGARTEQARQAVNEDFS